MRIRGERECRDCGRQWSYYETGSVTCPACGSLRSVGLDEPTEHTDGNATLDLSPAVRTLQEDRPISDVLDAVADQCSEFVRTAGFVSGGTLQPLGNRYLIAAELRHAADIVERAFDSSDAAELYMVSLLRSADDGERPPPDAVPDSLRAARGLAVASATDQYRRAVRRVLSDPRPEVSTLLGRIDEHGRRIEALHGDVDPRDAEHLVSIVQDVGEYVIDGDDDALARAGDRLNRLH